MNSDLLLGTHQLHSAVKSIAQPLMPVTAKNFAATSREASALSRLARAEDATFEIITKPDDVLALETDWNALDRANVTTTTAFQAFAWLKSWIKVNVSAENTAKGCARLAIVCGRDTEGRLVIILPFMICRSFSLEMVTWLGSPLAQYGDVLCHRDVTQDIVEQAFLYARQNLRVDLFCLQKVRDDAAVVEYLRSPRSICFETDTAPFVYQ